MGEWIPKEEWEAKQKVNQVKPVFVIPSEIKVILNPTTQKDDIQNFLTCICHAQKKLFGIENEMIIFRCACGMVYAYPDSHPLFLIQKQQTICICSRCTTEISPQQAKTSSEFIGQTLCEKCLGLEFSG